MPEDTKDPKTDEVAKDPKMAQYPKAEYTEDAEDAKIVSNRKTRILHLCTYDSYN